MSKVELKLINENLSVTQDFKKKVYKLKDLHVKLAKNFNETIFLRRCKKHRISPRSFLLKLPIKTEHSNKLKNKFSRALIIEGIWTLNNKKKKLKLEENLIRTELICNTEPTIWLKIWEYILTVERKCFEDNRIHCIRKFEKLCEYNNNNKQFIIQSKPKKNKTRIFNLSSNKILNENEIKILNKGLGFIPTINKINKLEIATNVELLGTKEKYKDIPTIVKKIIDKNPNNRDNISSIDRLTINKLARDDSIIIQNSDKGKNIVIIDKIDYDNKLLNIVNSDSYNILESDPTNKIDKELNLIIKAELKKDKNFSKAVVRNIKNKYTRHPAIYGQVKIHKTGYPLRPIITNYGTILEGASKYLANILTIIRNKLIGLNIVNNTTELLNNIKNAEIRIPVIMVSFDVVNLFGSIPLQELSNLIKGLLDNFNNFELQFGISRESFFQLFQLVINTSYFMFNESFYQQKHGVPMGSSISAIVADIFMYFIELKILEIDCDQLIKFWNRYVDDVLSFWGGSIIQLHTFLAKINGINQHIKFTMEIEDNKAINFLDVHIINKENKFNFSTFSKSTDSGIINNYKSFQQPNIRLNTLNNEIKRTINISDNLNNDLNKLALKFIDNGYPTRIVEESIDRAMLLSQPVGNGEVDKKANDLLILPYMGTITTKIKKATKEFNVKLISKNSKSLGNYFKKNYKYNTDIEAGVIYKIKCSCQKTYIGETGRKLAIRIKEHRNSIRLGYMQFAVASHIRDNPDHTVDFDNIEILARESDVNKRKIKEAIFIQNLKPELNLNLGVELKTEWVGCINSKIKY